MRSIVILSLANLDIQNDSRVLRQVKYLSREYPVEIISYGSDKPLPYPVKSLSIVGSLSKGKQGRMIKTILLLTLGRFWPERFYETWYWSRPGHREALDLLKKMDFCIVHANDWWTLPLAVRGVKGSNAKIILDLHEYALDELNDVLWWRVLYKPLVKFFFQKYLPEVNASITVNSVIAQRYASEFGLSPVVVMNAPDLCTEAGFRATDPQNIRLISHGLAGPNRHQDLLIEALAYADNRYSLTFMLFGNERYIQYLKKLANEKAPGRVFFIPSVPPSEVIGQINNFDMGVYLLKSSYYNNMVALPNKFFEFISAGLAVCIGPSPAMAQVIREFEAGKVSETFNPQDFGVMLSSLSSDDIDKMKRNSIRARENLNADVEMKKLLDLYQTLVEA